MEVTRKQFEDILDELSQIMDETDAIDEVRTIFDILGVDYKDIDELN